MVILPVTLNNPNLQTTPISTICVAFHIFVVGEHRDFKLGVQVDHSTSQPTDDKLALKGAWSRHVTRFGQANSKQRPRRASTSSHPEVPYNGP